jgi:hypothetical protein
VNIRDIKKLDKIVADIGTLPDYLGRRTLLADEMARPERRQIFAKKFPSDAERDSLYAAGQKKIDITFSNWSETKGLHGKALSSLFF